MPSAENPCHGVLIDSSRCPARLVDYVRLGNADDTDSSWWGVIVFAYTGKLLQSMGVKCNDAIEAHTADSSQPRRSDLLCLNALEAKFLEAQQKLVVHERMSQDAPIVALPATSGPDSIAFEAMLATYTRLREFGWDVSSVSCARGALGHMAVRRHRKGEEECCVLCWSYEGPGTLTGCAASHLTAVCSRYVPSAAPVLLDCTDMGI